MRTRNMIDPSSFILEGMVSLGAALGWDRKEAVWRVVRKAALVFVRFCNADSMDRVRLCVGEIA